MTSADPGGAAPPLLATKLHPPRRRRTLVARPRLRDLSSGGAHEALTLVSAPAGFGKTTLVADWFDDDETTAWLSLDPRDDDPVRFWTYVVAALATVVPELSTDADALLRAADPSIDAVVATLINELADTATDVVLVLDDYHVIESAEVHDSVAFLLDHLPRQLRLVIATRADPPLPLATHAGPRRAARGPGRRPPLHRGRGHLVPERRDGPDPRRRRHRRARGSDRGVDRCAAAGGAVDAGPRRSRRVRRRVRRRRPLHPRLPRRRGPRAPGVRRSATSCSTRRSSDGSPGRSALR